MSLSCLICHTLQRNLSNKSSGCAQAKIIKHHGNNCNNDNSSCHNNNHTKRQTQRNWSGCLRPRTSSTDCGEKASHKHQRGRSEMDFVDQQAVLPEPTTPIAEPRLVRSPGMRRDWSFEDPRNAIIAINTT